MNLFLESGATFSPCERYRYKLWRVWDRTLPLVAFVMLNPSKATAEVSDPTVTRCIGFAHSWGYGGVEVFNLFALRSTDPRELYKADDPVGPGNDEAIRLIDFAGDNIVVAAWGVHGKLRGRDQAVMRLFGGTDVRCLGITKDGHPKHPLYLAGDKKPIPFGAAS